MVSMAEDESRVMGNSSSPPEQKEFPLAGTIFLACATGASMVFGFGYALGTAKKSDTTSFTQGLQSLPPGRNGAAPLPESGGSLALRALGRGTVYAVLGVSAFSYAVWKMSGASNAKEFQEKVRRVFPQVKKNDPPVGRTEFASFRDLFEYLSTQKSEPKKKKSKSDEEP